MLAIAFVLMVIVFLMSLLEEGLFGRYSSPDWYQASAGTLFCVAMLLGVVGIGKTLWTYLP